MSAARPSVLALALLALGCAGDNPRDVARQGAADSASLGGTHMGPTLEAPPLIPAVRRQLDSLESMPYARARGQLDNYKGLIARLVAAVIADRGRLGLPAQEDFDALRDSILDPLGGGAGQATGPDSPEELREHTARVRRFIDRYERMVKERDGGRPRPDTAGARGRSNTVPTGGPSHSALRLT
ncbi:MAG TPA: hypothetical protein VNK43_07555 [Gemmatimonadales bacterium]|nr:hypothetical protein [Gemmatimonadales bacterium]